MKRLVAFLLAMIVLFAFNSALAEDWYCPECGALNNGNFCPNDGTKRPEGAGTETVSNNLKIDSVKLETDGSVTISWSGGTAPYNVFYEYFINDNHNAGADVTLWSASSGIYETQKNYEFDFVPGEHYWVIVNDAENHEAWYDYSEYVGAQTRINCSYFFSLRTRRNNRAAKVDYFSARDIKNEYSYHLFGATVKITPKIKQAVTINFRMAIKLPSGEPFLIHKELGMVSPGYGYYLWENFNFSSFWSKLMELKGDIPVGTYTFKLFFDNEFLFAQDFNITN